MIFFQRRRLVFWLVRAYLKKWKKTILLFFLLGLVAFFLLYILFKFIEPSPFESKLTIGIMGAYTLDSLPLDVSGRISYGLTGVSQNGAPYPLAASSWTIKDNGKTYAFKIKKNQYFTDGKKLTSKEINYNFENVNVEKPSDDTIIFKLKNSYSPFLITVSRPIFKKGLVGLGTFKVGNINLNGDFIESMELISIKNLSTIDFQFYPTEKALKTALLLGEIDSTENIYNLSVLDANLTKFRNLKIEKTINYNKLATLFYDTQNKVLSDKRLREALNYALPDNFEEGKRVHTPYPPTSWASQEEALAFSQDFLHSNLLLKQSAATDSAKLSFNLKTLPKYLSVARQIKESWKKIGVNVNIEKVDQLPSNFEIFLGEFSVSKDPDQYVLWHSDQQSNITGYKNLRIDKLLEDGRQITDISERKKIYSDFQKYLLDDPPVAFLFFPYNYTIAK